MPSVKSYFNFRLLRKNILRFWPIWGLYLLFWVFALPLRILDSGWEAYEMVGSLLTFGLFAAAFFGLFSAMAVFSYLYGSKSVHLMHSLPIRREGLFLTNYLSGLLFLLVPHLLAFLPAMAFGGYADPGPMVLWLVAQGLMCLFFYSFAVFCAMFTGNLLALPVFYVVLNFLAVSLTYVLDSLMHQFIFGFTGVGGLTTAAEWLSPIIRLTGDLRYSRVEGTNIFFLEGLPAILLYALVGLIFTALALVAYRRRKLETAGDIVSIPWVRPFFKYGVAFCSAVVLGAFVYDLLGDLRTPGNGSLLVTMLLCGVLGCFVAEMLLRKTFKVFAKGWKGAIAFCLILVAATSVMEYDLFGFNHAPNKNAVLSVELIGPHYTLPDDSGSRTYLTLTDSGDIERILALHEAIVSNKARIKDELDWARDMGTYATTTVRLYYTLEGGGFLKRSYDLPIRPERLRDPASPEAILTELINRPAHVENVYWGGIPSDVTLVSATLDIYPDNGYAPLSVADDDDRAMLLAAVKADMAAGRIGTRYLFDDAQRKNNCYLNDLTFTFYQPRREEPTPAGSEATLVADTHPQPRPASEAELANREWTVTVTPQVTSTETLKALRTLGLVTDLTPLQTHAQAEAFRD